MTTTANERDLRRAMLAGLADGQPRTRSELMRTCHVGRRSFDALRRELAHLGLLAHVDERLALTPIGHLHLARAQRVDDYC